MPILNGKYIDDRARFRLCAQSHFSGFATTHLFDPRACCAVVKRNTGSHERYSKGNRWSHLLHSRWSPRKRRDQIATSRDPVRGQMLERSSTFQWVFDFQKSGPVQVEMITKSSPTTHHIALGLGWFICASIIVDTGESSNHGANPIHIPCVLCGFICIAP